MFARRTLPRLILVTLLLAAQLSGCRGVFAPVPYRIEVAGEAFDVRRFAFMSRATFVEFAPVEVRRATHRGLGVEERALAEAVVAAYCAWFGYEVAPPAATFWTDGGTWHFVQGCARRV